MAEIIECPFCTYSVHDVDTYGEDDNIVNIIVLPCCEKWIDWSTVDLDNLVKGCGWRWLAFLCSKRSLARPYVCCCSFIIWRPSLTLPYYLIPIYAFNTQHQNFLSSLCNKKKALKSIKNLPKYAFNHITGGFKERERIWMNVLEAC